MSELPGFTTDPTTVWTSEGGYSVFKGTADDLANHYGGKIWKLDGIHATVAIPCGRDCAMIDGCWRFIKRYPEPVGPYIGVMAAAAEQAMAEHKATTVADATPERPDHSAEPKCECGNPYRMCHPDA